MLRGYSPNCIMMLPAYAHRVTTDESRIEQNTLCLIRMGPRGSRNIHRYIDRQYILLVMQAHRRNARENHGGG